MFLSDSRKRPGVEMRPGTGPTPSRRLEADVRELWGGLLRAERRGAGIAIAGSPSTRNTSAQTRRR